MNVLEMMIAEADATKMDDKWYSAAFKEIDGIGRVACYRDYGVRKAGRIDKVTKTNWKLNGKVISAANLQKVLSQ